MSSRADSTQSVLDRSHILASGLTTMAIETDGSVYDVDDAMQADGVAYIHALRAGRKRLAFTIDLETATVYTAAGEEAFKL